MERKSDKDMSRLYYTDDKGSFCMESPQDIEGLYLPLAGAQGLKSAVTPIYAGDSKTDQNHFLYAPKSIRGLSDDADTRNFFLVMKDRLWSAMGMSAEQILNRYTDREDEVTLYGGRMRQRTVRRDKSNGIEAETTITVLTDEPAELITVKISNKGDKAVTFYPVAALPLYGRSADNLRDHRHVTSLLHRVCVDEYGITLKPVLSFDERGHRLNDTVYFVYGADGDGNAPESFMTDTDAYIGSGSFIRPESLIRPDEKAWLHKGDRTDGGETTAVLRFAQITLLSGESVSYQLTAGITTDVEEARRIAALSRTEAAAKQCFDAVAGYWDDRLPIHMHTSDTDYDRYMEWIGFQPQLRRIFGCSFLPHHDYGRGGRGWRDLWQDCLALLLTEPESVGEMIAGYFAGVRTDGTNATIIGDEPGEFKADRNGIARVWMDHGFWPFLTLKLYIDQTGDIDILTKEIGYFKDALICRADDRDEEYTEAMGVKLRTASGEIYKGTILEHLLIQNLTAFYDVGEHNELRLRGADWNDALDMAAERGESVAFSCAYAGNLKDIAAYMRIYQAITGNDKVSLLKELDKLIFSDDEVIYGDVSARRGILNDYMQTTSRSVSGERAVYSIEAVVLSLLHKSEYMMKRIRQTEWISDRDEGWYNSYYTNRGEKAEGTGKDNDTDVRMMLTGQVFAIMSGTAKTDDIRKIVHSADRYLYDDRIGGYRLNTDFGGMRTDLGRMFGFAYGEKENGAVFSHMAVMYANALYKRGFAREGYKALDALFRASSNYEISRIYPGIPEYFNNEGRGLYHYLTGAASWYMLTVVTESFGIRGNAGDLHIEPKLVKEQFDKDGAASIDVPFAGFDFRVTYHNKGLKDYGEYTIGDVIIDGTCTVSSGHNCVSIPRKWMDNWAEKSHVIDVELV